MLRITVIVAAGLCQLGRGSAQNVDGELRSTFEKLYARIDAATARQDEAELKRLIAPDGQATAGPVNISLRAWLSSAMKVAGLSRRSEVTDVRLDSADAVVAVNVHFTVASGGTKKESVTSFRERWVRSEEGWVCKVSAEIGGESKLPATSPEAAKPVIAELKIRAAKLATVVPGAEIDDLEAFGAAVGDARIVALGEATHGTREFFQIKQRLVEYLVRRKGFSVLAFEMNWPGASEAVRRAEEVLAHFDAHKSDWVRVSSNAEWRDARHAAATVVAACAMRLEANGLGYRDRMMSRNLEWLADEVHPGEKIIVWAHNGHIAMDNDGYEKMGGWLRKRFGKQFYTVGFAFRRGEVWATGVEDGRSRGEGAWPLSASHRFHSVGGIVMVGGEGANMTTESLSAAYDGLFFVENSHAIRPR